MFSATPRMGTPTLANIAAPRSATETAAVCGVVTMIAPLRAIDWAMESWASPVPGGRSMSRTSSSPQRTFVANCEMVFMIIGPRQTTGASASMRRPIDMTFTPKFSRGMRVSPSRRGRALTPIIRGTEGP